MKTVALSHAAEVTLGRQRAPQYEAGDHVIPYLRSANILDGGLDISDVKEMNFTPVEQRVYSLTPGDVLVTEGSGSRDTVGASAVWRGEIDGVVCFQNTLIRLRPRLGISDGRYVGWWARHAHAAGLMAEAASGANILHLGVQTLRRLTVTLPSVEEQRRIADFLDDQVTRIDNIIALRQAQAERLDEMKVAAAQNALLVGGRPTSEPPWYEDLPRDTVVRRLRAIWSVIDCKHRTPDYVAAGYPVVSPGDIAKGPLDLARCTRFVTEEDWRDLADEMRRCRIGDVVYSRNASVGSAALVTTTDPFTMGQDVCRITSADQDQRYLSHVLNYAVTPQLEAARVGSTITRINVDQIKALAIPVPPAAHQATRAIECGRRLQEIAHFEQSLMVEFRTF